MGKQQPISQRKLLASPVWGGCLMQWMSEYYRLLSPRSM